ncbi:MAG TPA: efflux RND transporter permease subunit [Verrucomicrobiae bacterium]|nr:efflux RND transporter permease subunit [Verrucomicrobiae bacterium]
MLNRIVQFSLRHRGVVVALGAIVIAYGLYVAARTKLDVFPEFAPPQVEIQTESPGLASEEVEQLVTTPIETGLNGTPGLDAIRSQSIQGLSVVTLVFRDNTDIFRDRQMVTERLGEIVGHLPQGAGPPRLGPLTSSTSLTLVMGLTSTNRTAMELRTFADWTMRPYLLSVPGVATVDIFGGDIRQLQVQVKPDRLRAYGLSVDDVLSAAQVATGVRGGGYVDTVNQRIVIHTTGQSLTAEQLGEVVLAPHAGLSVRLKDVADVREAPAPQFGAAQINGRSGVVLLAYAQYQANTLEVTRALDAALAQMKPALAAEKIDLKTGLFRPANFILSALHNVNLSLLLGGALVAVVLFFFLLDWRTAFISFISIPLSLLAAMIVLSWSGVAINTITLGGFAIAIGVVVDDAIIDVENILRRLRENSASTRPRSLFQVVLHASLEVNHAVVYATFIIAMVFLPVLMMGGVQGRLFAPLGISFILAILASLAVALTVTPALCYLILSKVTPHVEPNYVRWLKARHRGWLEGVSRRSRTVMGLALLLCLGAAATLPFFGGEFMPDLQEGHYVLHMSAVPGTSLAESIRLGKRVTAALLNNAHVRSVEQQAGRAENGEDTFGPQYSELHVDLQPPLRGEDPDVVEGQIRAILGQFPGLTFSVESFLAERMEETLSGTTAEFVVNIFGNDLDALDEKAGEVRQVLSKIPGAVDVNLTTQPGLPELSIRLRPERLLQYGFRPVDVLNDIETAYEGTAVSQIYDGNRVFDVAVILDEKDRSNPESVGSLPLRNAQGVIVPLRELADIQLSNGRYAVMHEGAQRLQQVTCNVTGRDVASFAAEVKRKIATQLNFPPGMFPVYAGSAQAETQARHDLFVHSLLAGAGIVLLLTVLFGSGRNVSLILANLPFALVGGVLAVFASGGSLSVGSLVGFVTLFGITLRNSIMLISHFEHLVNEEGLTWGLETAIRGASERLLPILMTATVTGLGLLPLAIGSGEAGREIEGPMAIVILGGLITSTLLNLLVLPTLALRFGRFKSNGSDQTVATGRSSN